MVKPLILYLWYNQNAMKEHTKNTKTFIYKEDFIEISTKLHYFTYHSQPTTKKEKKQNTVQNKIEKIY